MAALKRLRKGESLLTRLLFRGTISRHLSAVNEASVKIVGTSVGCNAFAARNSVPSLDTRSVEWDLSVTVLRRSVRARAFASTDLKETGR